MFLDPLKFFWFGLSFSNISCFPCNILQHLNLWRKSLKLIPICLAQWLVELLTANSGIETLESRYLVKVLMLLFWVAVFTHFCPGSNWYRSPKKKGTWYRSMLDPSILQRPCILKNFNASDCTHLFRMGMFSLHSTVKKEKGKT